MAENQPPPRIELFELADGLSFIDVRGGADGSLLLVDGKPISLHWCDCEGSVAQYLVRAGSTDCENKLRMIRHVLDGNINSGQPISAQILPFLELFVPGLYKLQQQQCYEGWACVEFDSSWDSATSHGGFYPFDSTLIFTQSVDSLNQERVDHYALAITNGARPIALTATSNTAWCDFVLDGHHKLQAYKLVNVRPEIISVSRLNAPALASDTFTCWFDANHPLADHYRKAIPTSPDQSN